MMTKTLAFYLSPITTTFPLREWKTNILMGQRVSVRCECRRLDWAAAEAAAAAAAAAAASTRWGQISPAGGALLPGCDPARLFHTGVWEVPWTSWYGTMDVFSSSSAGAIPAAMWFARTRRVESKVSWLAPLSPVSLAETGTCRAPMKCICQWRDGGVTAGLNDGSPLKR